MVFQYIKQVSNRLPVFFMPVGNETKCKKSCLIKIHINKPYLKRQQDLFAHDRRSKAYC